MWKNILKYLLPTLLVVFGIAYGGMIIGFSAISLIGLIKSLIEGFLPAIIFYSLVLVFCVGSVLSIKYYFKNNGKL
jgi:hypothetical protein